MPPPTPTDPAVATQTSPRPGRFAWVRPLAAPFRRLGRWFSYQPRALRYGFIVVALVGVAAGGVYGRVHLKKRASARETAAAWGAFNDAARDCDLDAMRAALDRLAAANPADPLPGRYRGMIDRGEADADSPDLADVFLTHHMRNNRLPEAAREAAKVLTKYPKDWQARCTLADHAMRAGGDFARGEQLLAELPDPEDPQARVKMGGVLYALQLSQLAGRDAGTLRLVVLRRLVPLTRSGNAANAPPAAKVQLIECYLQPFADPAALTELADFWAAVDKLADAAVTGAAEAADVPTLVRAGELGPRMRAALAALRDNDPNRLPPDRYAALLAAINDRTRKAWEAVREKEPARPEPYRGLAVVAWQANDAAAAAQILLDGIAKCDGPPELLQLLAAIVTRAGTGDELRLLLKDVWQRAERARTDPSRWCVAVELAFALGRADESLVACRNALALQPDHLHARTAEVRLLLRAGKYSDARDSLARIGEPTVLAAPALAQLHARALVGAGLWVLVDDEYKKLLDAREKSRTKSPVAAVGFLLGVLDAPADPARAAWVAAKAELLQAAAPDAPLAGRVKAEALFRLAELSAAPNPKDPSLPPVWNADRVVAALRALGQLSLAERAEPEILAATATLLLKGQGQAVVALRTVSSLLANPATLSARQLEIVGAVLLANDRPADAVRVLERVDRSSPTVGCLAALAVAYHQNQQLDRAEAALARAEALPGRSDREQAELVAAKFLLTRKTP